MPGSSFGQIVKIVTFGESHGAGLGVVMEGVPPMMPLDVSEIQQELDRRRPGQSDLTTPRKEGDQVEILSGVFEGLTTGAPIALLIRNTNQHSKDYSHLESVFRPGHADYTFFKKYGFRDHRGGGRSSGRETAARVAAGAIAKKFLSFIDVKIIGFTKSVEAISSDHYDYSVIEKNPVRAADLEASQKMEAAILQAKSEHDSVGGIIETHIIGSPVGLGDPVFEKLEARLALGIMSIGTVKGIEFGSGFSGTRLRGSVHNDAFVCNDGTVSLSTNHSGGTLGGISSGEMIVFRTAIKPVSSIAKSQSTVTITGEETTLSVVGRHDPCICPRAVPVIEAMAALVVMDCYLMQQTIPMPFFKKGVS